MSYKTILAYVPSPGHVKDLMNVVVPLAESHEAHIVGLHVTTDIPVYGISGGEIPSVVFSEQRALLRKDADVVRAAFETAASATSVPTEWRCKDIIYPSFERELVDQARLADLVVVSQKDNDPLDAWSDLSTRLIMETGRPVLIVPRNGTFKSVGENVLLAWNGTRESMRAAMDALPLLQRAKTVNLVVINPTDEERKKAIAPGDELALLLARHGVNAEVHVDIAPDTDVPNELLSKAAEFGSDIIVMGCYSHSRLREFVFGGATREIMKSMTVPILMSH